MDKPEDCAICYGKLGDEKSLECGHWLHMSCVQKHFKPECPLCRKPLNIKVYGTRPEVFIPEENDEEQFEGSILGVRFSMRLPRNIIGNVVERNIEPLPDEEDEDNARKRRRSDDESWREKGYQYAEEDSEYDEENPRGDNWDYEDV
jgi:hypothetical protein